MKLSTVTFLALTVLCGIIAVHADDNLEALVTQVGLVVGDIQAWKQNTTKQLEVITKELRRVERERDTYKEGLGKLAKDFVALRLQVNQTADDARSYARMRCCGMKVTKVSESSLSTMLSTMMSTTPNPVSLSTTVPSQDRSQGKTVPPKPVTTQDPDPHVIPSKATDAELFSAISEGNLKRVKQILATGHVDINTREKRGMTPVMLAAFRGHSDVVEFLVARGADVSLVDSDGNNVLHLACYDGDMETVKLILSLGIVDINARNIKGKTAGDVARNRVNKQVLEYLVSRGAS